MEENNKLIAEFMGFQKTNIGWYDSEEIMPPMSNTYDSNTFDELELSFHKSWDWLMPVVDKINNLKTLHFIVLEGKRVQWIVEDDESMRIVYQGKPMIEMTYQAVVEFINFYNKNIK